MLKLSNVSFGYKDRIVIENLSFSASKGEIIGLVAPNGMGKTTLFNIMANFLKPDKGKVIFNENYIYKSEKDEKYIHQHLSTFPDQSDLYEELTGVDHLKLYANMWNRSVKHVPTIIDELQMGNYVKRKVKTYSLGMRQRLCFAMMVAADTSVMLMDEVMNGLDVENVALISNKLLEMKQDEKLIFVASHLLDNLDLYADQVFFLKDGQIIYTQETNNESNQFLKVKLTEQQYEKLTNIYQLPADHEYIAYEHCCIPLKGLNQSEQIKWIERLLAFTNNKLTIGPLGTVEFYEKYYHEHQL